MGVNEQYKCKHFDIKELVSKHVYKQRGEKAWWMLDPRALMMLDLLREDFGPITVNDWSWGGSSQYRGLRMPGTKYYSRYSSHSFGMAFDCIFANHTAEEVRLAVKANPERYKYISGIEEGVSWFHFDVRNSPFMAFYP